MSDEEAELFATDPSASTAVYAYFPFDGWEQLFALDNNLLGILHCTKVGWLLHTAFCMTGCLGHLEKPVVVDGIGSWKRVSNVDPIDASYYRYIAKLDPRRAVTYRDIFPATKTFSVKSSSTGLTSLSSLSAEGTEEQAEHEHIDVACLRPKSLSPLLNYVSWSAKKKTPEDFRDALLRRDVTDTYAGLTQNAQAAHLVNPDNPLWLLDVIAETRGFGGGDSRSDWLEIKSMYDPELGVLLMDSFHAAIQSANMGTLRVPNFGMLDLDNGRPESDSTVVPTTRPDDRFNIPVPLSQEALHLHNLLPEDSISTWAGVSSTVHLIPFTDESETMLAWVTTNGNRSLRTSAPPGTPPAKSPRWPLNALFDWMWGARIARTFGSPRFCLFSQKSSVTAAIEEYRRDLRGKRKPQRREEEEEEEDSPTKKKPRVSKEGEMINSAHVLAVSV